MTEEFISVALKKRKFKRGKRIKKKSGKEAVTKHNMRLFFQERCPEASEVRQLHPKIQHVFVPKRPASVRYCILKFDSAEALEEVHSALHKKHVEPYKGILRCTNTVANMLADIKKSNPELLSHKYLTKVDIKHAKFIHNKKLGATRDMKFNSTERELFVRFGVVPKSLPENIESNNEIINNQSVTEVSDNESDESDES